MKDIKGYEGLYAITSCGKVWSYRSKRFLKSRLVQGYEQITLSLNGKLQDYKVHRLVAEAYIPNPLGLPQVNHLDEVKTHNWVGNLEWMTAKENCNYGTRTKRMAEKLRISMSKSVYCVELDRVFIGASAASRELGIDNSSISKCCKGSLKTAGGYLWKYVEGV